MGVKIKLYQRVVVPMVTYGMETWDLYIVDKHNIDVVEMNSLRKDKFRNVKLRYRVCAK